MHVYARLVKMSGELLLRERKTLIQERLKANGRVLAADLAAEPVSYTHLTLPTNREV